MPINNANGYQKKLLENLTQFVKLTHSIFLMQEIEDIEWFKLNVMFLHWGQSTLPQEMENKCYRVIKILMGMYTYKIYTYTCR